MEVNHVTSMLAFKGYWQRVIYLSQQTGSHTEEEVTWSYGLRSRQEVLKPVLVAMIISIDIICLFDVLDGLYLLYLLCAAAVIQFPERYNEVYLILTGDFTAVFRQLKPCLPSLLLVSLSKVCDWCLNIIIISSWAVHKETRSPE